MLKISHSTGLSEISILLGDEVENNEIDKPTDQIIREFDSSGDGVENNQVDRIGGTIGSSDNLTLLRVVVNYDEVDSGSDKVIVNLFKVQPMLQPSFQYPRLSTYPYPSL